MPSVFDHCHDLLVVGGGPAGYFAALAAAEKGVSSIIILEATSSPLNKVLISGGGRCNITHECFDNRELSENYPRGQQSLLGAFYRFSVSDTLSWFSDKGLEIVSESDGRMFPISNKSSSVVDCLKSSAKATGVVVRKKSVVNHLQKLSNNNFIVTCRNGSSYVSQKVLLATGAHPSGRLLAKSFGHNITPPVPSLFSLDLEGTWLTECSGIPMDNIHLSMNINGQQFKESGRVILTHWGISGPAVLRLTAFAACALKSASYRSRLRVNWLSNFDANYIKKTLNQFRYQSASKTLLQSRPFTTLPKRVWRGLLLQIRANTSLRWADLPVRLELDLFNALTASEYEISGRGPFGEEFVTAGGIPLAEVDARRLESRFCPGLYFAGELLNVDGVTGGFNFQHCWTSGWLAGTAIAE